VIKPAYSVSFLLSINIFVWQNVLYVPNDPRSWFYCKEICYDVRSHERRISKYKTNIPVHLLNVHVNPEIVRKYVFIPIRL